MKTCLATYTLRSGVPLSLELSADDSDEAMQAAIDVFVARVRRDSRNRHTPLWLAHGGLENVRAYFASLTSN